MNEFYMLQNEILTFGWLSRKVNFKFYLCWKLQTRPGVKLWIQNITSSWKNLPSIVREATGSGDSKVNPTRRRCQYHTVMTPDDELYVWGKFTNFNEFIMGVNVRNSCGCYGALLYNILLVLVLNCISQTGHKLQVIHFWSRLSLMSPLSNCILTFAFQSAAY